MSSSPSSVKDKDDPDNHATSDTVQPIHIDDEPPPPVAMMSTSPEASVAAGAATAGKEKTRPKFMCGVVEGFYGRPWTTEQRKDLFCKMQVIICSLN